MVPYPKRPLYYTPRQPIKARTTPPPIQPAEAIRAAASLPHASLVPHLLLPPLVQPTITTPPLTPTTTIPGDFTVTDVVNDNDDAIDTSSDVDFDELDTSNINLDEATSTVRDVCQYETNLVSEPEDDDDEEITQEFFDMAMSLLREDDHVVIDLTLD